MFIRETISLPLEKTVEAICFIPKSLPYTLYAWWVVNFGEDKLLARQYASAYL